MGVSQFPDSAAWLRCLGAAASVATTTAPAAPLPSPSAFYFAEACIGNDCVSGGLASAQLDKQLSASGTQGDYLSYQQLVQAIASPFGPLASVQSEVTLTYTKNQMPGVVGGRSGGLARVFYDVGVVARSGLVYQPTVVPVDVSLMVDAQLSGSNIAQGVAGARVHTHLPIDPSGRADSSRPEVEQYLIADAVACVNRPTCSAPYRGSGAFTTYAQPGGVYRVTLTATVGYELWADTASADAYAGADPIFSIGSGTIPGTDALYSDWFDIVIPAGVTQAVPEPSMVFLLLAGVSGVASRVRRAQQR